MIGPNTKLGQAVYVNFQVGIGHDAQIGDFVQINPGAQIGGLVTVGNSGTDRIRLDNTRKTLCRKQRDSRIRIILFRKSSRECNCHWKSRKTHESVRMRVLHVYSGNLYGGLEKTISVLAQKRHLTPGLEFVFGLCFEEQLSQELREAGVQVFMLNPVQVRKPWTVLKARQQLRTWWRDPKKVDVT